MSGRWRQRLTGAEDEFSEKGPGLTTEQREHLTRVTDELLQRYSISRSVGPGDSADGVQGELVSADEIGAVLEAVLVEAFDFGWFTRSDLPEAPELAYEAEEAGWEQASAGARASSRVLEPVEWPDPGAAEDESIAEWGLDLSTPRAIDPQPESELIAELEPELEPEPDLEQSPTADTPPELDRTDALVAAAVEVAELEEIHRTAVADERDAIMFAAATRQRLAEARERLAEMQSARP